MRAERKDGACMKYSPHWSLPAKVMVVKPGAVVVQDWGANQFNRQVPKQHVRKLEGTVPKTLQELAVKMLEYESPRARRPRMLTSGGPETVRSWPQLLDEADPQAGQAKRRRN
eukprot:Selendium_serpulae@DN5830_c1_g2_i1.p1